MTAFGQHHDLTMLALAFGICAAGSVLSMRLFARVRRSEDRTRTYWMFFTGLLTGGTIWSTHFISMLGFVPGVAHTYEPFLTVLSLVVVVLFTYAGLSLAALGRNDWRIEAGCPTIEV